MAPTLPIIPAAAHLSVPLHSAFSFVVALAISKTLNEGTSGCFHSYCNYTWGLLRAWTGAVSIHTVYDSGNEESH